MSLGRIGGILLIAGAACYVVSIALVPPGGTTGPIDPSSAMEIVALVLGGLGAVVLARAGAAPLDRPALRNGLGLLGLGLLCVAVAAAGYAIALGAGTDPLGSLDVTFFFLGYVVIAVAVVALGVTFVRGPGPARLIGGLLLLGFLFLVVLVQSALAGWASQLEEQSGFAVADILRMISTGCLLLGSIGIGMLAIAGSRPRHAGPA